MKMSSGEGEWQSYGPEFRGNDIIGCGLLGSDLFYTKNGAFLGVAFRGVPGGLYPSVSLQDETVVANFGQKPFCFQLDWDKLRTLCR